MPWFTEEQSQHIESLAGHLGLTCNYTKEIQTFNQGKPGVTFQFENQPNAERFTNYLFEKIRIGRADGTGFLPKRVMNNTIIVREDELPRLLEHAKTLYEQYEKLENDQTIIFDKLTDDMKTEYFWRSFQDSYNNVRSFELNVRFIGARKLTLFYYDDTKQEESIPNTRDILHHTVEITPLIETLVFNQTVINHQRIYTAIMLHLADETEFQHRNVASTSTSQASNRFFSTPGTSSSSSEFRYEFSLDENDFKYNIDGFSLITTEANSQKINNILNTDSRDFSLPLKKLFMKFNEKIQFSGVEWEGLSKGDQTKVLNYLKKTEICNPLYKGLTEYLDALKEVPKSIQARPLMR